MAQPAITTVTVDGHKLDVLSVGVSAATASEQYRAYLEKRVPYIAKRLGNYNEKDKKVIGTGHCVPLVQDASGAPQTSAWTRGKRVKGDNTIARGTAIATFDSQGKYTNSTDGTSHAAIYIEQNSIGIHVWDQWLGQPVHMRWIRFQGGAPHVKPVNDGDAFYIIE